MPGIYGISTCCTAHIDHQAESKPFPSSMSGPPDSGSHSRGVTPLGPTGLAVNIMVTVANSACDDHMHVPPMTFEALPVLTEVIQTPEMPVAASHHWPPCIRQTCMCCCICQTPSRRDLCGCPYMMYLRYNHGGCWNLSSVIITASCHLDCDQEGLLPSEVMYTAMSHATCMV